MKIAEPIEKYYDLKIELTEAVSQNDQMNVDQLDSELSSTFETILLSEANELETVKLQAKFLLQYLSPIEHQSTLEARTCEKIIDLMTSE